MEAPASSGLLSNDEIPGITFLLPPGSARTSGRPPTSRLACSHEKTCTRVPVLPASKMTA